MVVTTPKGTASRNGSVMKPEYRGKEFTVLLTDGPFHLIDTSPARTGAARYEDAWIWHMCDEYPRRRDESEGGSDTIGLLSNKEMYKQRCEYCGSLIPDGMIGQWKMLNWNRTAEIEAWDTQYGG